jgi:transposase-like protein
MLYLAFKDIAKKWTMPVRNWAFVISHLSIIFNDRIKDFI